MNQEKLFTEKMEKIKKEFGERCMCKLKEFKQNKDLNENERFNELCFCILVAGSNLEQTKKAWEENKRYFLTLDERSLKEKLRKSGCRFNHRANYIASARKAIKKIDFNENPFVLRENLVKTIKGLGMKEASHFLRNMGYKNFAILDTHVLKTLRNYNIIKEIPKTLTKNKYLEIEGILDRIAKDLKISQAELDAYLFYLDSKKLPQK